MRLDRVARAARRADRPAEQHVVREDEVGRQVLAERRCVRLDVRLALREGEVLEQARLEPLVAVEDEHGQQAADVGLHDGRAAEVEPFGMRLLREDGDVVSRPGPLADERLRVDVRAGTAQEVAVPDEDAHGPSKAEGTGCPAPPGFSSSCPCRS